MNRNYSINEWGPFGDVFGGLTAIFSGLSFAGVIIAILMQMQELRLTREEMKKSVDAQNESQKALKDQLKQMQWGTKFQMITSLKNDRISQRDVPIVNKIADKLSIEVLHDPAFKDIITPDLFVMAKSINVEKSKANIQLNNKSAGCDIVISPLNDAAKKIEGNFVFIGGDRNTKATLSYNGGVIVQLQNIDINIPELEFLLTLESDFVKRTWQQILIIKIEGKTIEAILKPIELKDK